MRIVLSFGTTKENAQDIVSEMYLKMQILINKGLDITYNSDDINYWYVYKTLKSIFLNIKVKQDKIKKIEIGEVANIISLPDVEYKDTYEEYVKELNLIDKYYKDIYLFSQEMSIRDLERKTGIEYHKLYNTTKKVKQHLKNKLNL